MELSKLRKLAGLQFIAEAKEEKTEEKKKPELPAEVLKQAAALTKKFGIGAPDGSESEDLTAVQDFMMKVFAAGVASAAAEPVAEEIHVAKPNFGQSGTIVILNGEKSNSDIADILGLQSNWHLQKVGKGYAAYDGERLTFFSNASDFQSDEDEDE